MKNENFKYAFVLGIITFAAALVLNATFNLTKGAIQEVERQNFLKGLNAVLPAFDNDPGSDSVVMDGYKVYIAKKDGKVTGYAVESVSPKGYGGSITVLVGATPDGKIYNITVLKHSETPGLGDKIGFTPFTDLFKGRAVKDHFAVKADGGYIDQFSGATVSPRAVCDAVNRALPAIITAVEGGSL